MDLTKYIEENTFRFDYAYDEQADNQQIYAQAIQPLIRNAFQGAKISCFAYGQTGSGKTYTMKGEVGKQLILAPWKALRVGAGGEVVVSEYK